jgi:RHS repeat-associated protein
VPTDRLFTGQRFDGTIGLYDYGARFYDPALGRFVQADTIVPNPANPQDLNRYAYVRNNPLRYVDPSGYMALGYDPGWGFGGCSVNDLACLAAAGAGAYKQAYGVYGYPTDEKLEAACAAGYNPFLDPDYAGASVPAYEPYFDFYYRWAYDTGGWLPLPSGLRSDVFAYWTFVATGNVPHPTGWRDVAAMVSGDANVYVFAGSAVAGWLGSRGQAAGMTPYQIGRWGEKQVARHLPVEVRQFRVAGGRRVYDGRMPATRQYVEIKTTTQGTVYPSSRIRGQIAFDTAQEIKPLWIFVNGNPSRGLQVELGEAGIPWRVLNVP